MAPRPTCICGACRKCRRREYMRAYYNRLTPEERRAKFIAGRDQDAVRARDRARYHRMKDDPGYMRKRKAREILNNAITRGAVVREPCEVCGATPTDAHHDDYSRPLEVRWLCRRHHADEHRSAA